MLENTITLSSRELYVTVPVCLTVWSTLFAPTVRIGELPAIHTDMVKPVEIPSAIAVIRANTTDSRYGSASKLT